MHHFNVEGLKELLYGNFIEHYKYNKTFEEAAQDPFLVVHTSGSTALPKPIIMYHGGVTTVDNQHLIPSLDGFDAHRMVLDVLSVSSQACLPLMYGHDPNSEIILV